MLNENKLVIVAPNIKNGGGKELLEYLIEYIEHKYPFIYVTVYIDSSIISINSSNMRTVVSLSSVYDKIMLFTKQIDNSLYFGNLPPLRKARNSIVYFHNPYLLMDIKSLLSSSFKLFVKYSLQQLYIHTFIRNVTSVACQSMLIKNSFLKKYKFENIEILPFFRACDKSLNKLSHKKYDFCYVSLAHPHKNHLLLFQAMKLLAEEKIHVRLAVTIEVDKEELINEIKSINSLGIVYIDNLGVLSKEKVCQLYSNSICSIFPSKEETFGLALIEAVEIGLDVITSDLPYVHQVIRPSLCFDAYDSKMCAKMMKMYIKGHNVEKSIGLVKNEIDQLVNKFIKQG